MEFSRQQHLSPETTPKDELTTARKETVCESQVWSWNVHRLEHSHINRSPWSPVREDPTAIQAVYDIVDSHYSETKAAQQGSQARSIHGPVGLLSSCPILASKASLFNFVSTSLLNNVESR